MERRFVNFMETKKIRWGILATGFIANQFASDLRYCQNSELVAVASRNADSAKIFAKKYQIHHVYDDYKTLAESPEVDVVYIATPHHLHYPNAKMCLEQGKHVLCEKPMTLNAALSADLIDTAKKHNCFLMEAIWTKFIPAVKRAIEIVSDGTIGNIIHCVSDFGFKAKRDPQHRLFNPEYGGGSLLDVGIYPLALTYFFMGSPRSIKSSMLIGPTQVDERCSMNLDYGHSSAQLYSSITVDTKLNFSLIGEKGFLDFIGPLYAPNGISFKVDDQIETLQFPFEGNGYQFEAMEVEKVLFNRKIESNEVSWKTSLNLAKMMDEISLSSDRSDFATERISKKNLVTS